MCGDTVDSMFFVCEQDFGESGRGGGGLLGAGAVQPLVGRRSWLQPMEVGREGRLRA